MCFLRCSQTQALVGTQASHAHPSRSALAAPQANPAPHLPTQTAMTQTAAAAGGLSSPDRGRLPTATTDRAPGDIVLERYTIERTLGDGSSGTTYAARDNETGARVAVKELALGRLKTWKQLELFEREAQTLRGLSHPNIPRYLDYQQSEGCFFLVQELADGPTLAQLMAGRSRLDDAAVTRIARDLLETLAYLSSRRCAPHQKACVICGEAALVCAHRRRRAASKVSLRAVWCKSQI